MPPSKPRTAPEDSRSEGSSTKEKLGNVAGLAANGKGRRVASSLGIASSLKDSATTGVATMATTGGPVGSTGQDVNAGVDTSCSASVNALTDDGTDAMVNNRYIYTACISICLPIEYAVCFQ